MQNSTKSSWLSPAQSSGEGNQDKPRSTGRIPAHRLRRVTFHPSHHGATRSHGQGAPAAGPRSGSGAHLLQQRAGDPSPAGGHNSQLRGTGGGRGEGGRRRLCLVCQPRGSRRGGALPPPSGGCRLPLRKGREPRPERRDTGPSPRGRWGAAERCHVSPPPTAALAAAAQPRGSLHPN